VNVNVNVNGAQRADSRRFAQAMQAGARERPLWMRGDPGCEGSTG